MEANEHSATAVDEAIIQMIDIEEQQAEDVSLNDHVINPDDIVALDTTRNPLFAAFAKKKEKGNSNLWGVSSHVRVLVSCCMVWSYVRVTVRH